MLRSLGTGSVAAAATTGVLGPAPTTASAPVAEVVRPGAGVDLGVGPVARPVDGAAGSDFGMRRHPIHGDVRMHTGVDLRAATGDPIGSFAAGTVVFAGPRGGYGNLVIVDHGNGITTRYAHASRIDVTVGQRVGAGQVLARVGATGTATGPHLHFEIRRDGQAIDPAGYLP
jgi:murein DD-endopeptidase MepM/ murein hydrolase activator NlpD